jgi:ABC-type polar amino acid transport system ATPase subunit
MENEATNTPILRVTGLKKNFGEREILKGIDFEVHKSDVVCIIGPSGSGKSTLIRCVNFLEEPTAGTIYYEGKDVRQSFKKLPSIEPRWAWSSSSSTFLTTCPLWKTAW